MSDLKTIETVDGGGSESTDDFENFLSNHMDYLCQNTMGVTQLMTVLMNSRLGGMTFIQSDEIKRESTLYDKCYALYRWICQKGLTYGQLTEALCESGNEHIVKYLKQYWTGTDDSSIDDNKECSNQKKERKLNDEPIRFNLVDPVASFCGRETFLDQLHLAIQQDGRTVLSQLRIVSGLGGIGKTQVARAYVKEYEKFYRNFVWINAESRTSMEASIVQLCQEKLALTTKDGDGKPIAAKFLIERLYHSLCVQATLFIFDNADNDIDQMDHDLDHSQGTRSRCPTLEEFLPTSLPQERQKNLFILVTSRNGAWGSKWRQVIRLDFLSEIHSYNFLVNQLDLTNEKMGGRQKEDDLGLKELVKLLGGLPLALQQAAAYIREERERSKFSFHRPHSFTVMDYVKMFEKTVKKNRRRVLNYPPLDSPTGTTVYTTWNVTFEKICGAKNNDNECGRVAMELMEIMAFLDPDKINSKLLFLILTSLKEPQAENVNPEIPEMEDALRLLETYSMISCSGPQAEVDDAATTIAVYIIIHRLVQHVVLETLLESGRFQTILAKLLNLRANLCVAIRATCSHRLYKDLLTNQLSMVKKISLIPEPVPSKFLEAKVDVALQFIESGNYQQDISLLLEVYQIKNKMAPTTREDRLDLAHLMKKIASVLQDQGLYEEALTWYERSVSTFKIELGQDSYECRSCQHDLAVTLHLQGKWREALVQYEKLLKFYGTQPPQVVEVDKSFLLTIQNNVAAVHRYGGEYSKAADMFEKVYMTGRRSLGPRHHTTIFALFGFAIALKNLKQFDLAMMHFKEAYELQVQVQSPESPLALEISRHIAAVLRHQKMYGESMELYRHVYKMQVEVHGEGHYYCWLSQHGIAAVNAKLGEYEEALRVAEDVYQRQMEGLGVDHFDTLDTQFLIATILSKLKGREGEALNMHQMVRTRRSTILGSAHPLTKKSFKAWSSLL